MVPYCLILSKIFNAHINVEYCNTVKSIKYICKYVNKGSDQAVFGLERQEMRRDEVSRYEIGRYICSSEATWRILDFPIHHGYPPVKHLYLHLENQQRVYFTEDNVRDRIAEPPKTTLTAFFHLCRVDEFAKTLLYCDVPQYYRWDRQVRNGNDASRASTWKDIQESSYATLLLECTLSTQAHLNAIACAFSFT